VSGSGQQGDALLNPEDVVLAAGDLTLRLLDGKVSEETWHFFGVLSATAFKVCGNELVARVRNFDKPGLLLPIDVW